MIISLLFLLIGIAIGALITWGYWIGRMGRHKEQMRLYAAKVEELTSNYDEYRRKYLDLDDQYGELKSQEQTYRVAYHEWKEKFEALSHDFHLLQASSDLRGQGSEKQASLIAPDLDATSLKTELDRVKRALSQTTAQVDRQAELIRLHNKQAERLESLKGQLMALIDHGREIAIKNQNIKPDSSDPRVTDLNDL